MQSARTFRKRLTLRDTAALGGLALVQATPAFACPSCAAGRDDGGLATLVLIGGMIAAPYVVGLVTYLVLRRAHTRSISPAHAKPSSEFRP